MSQRLIDESMKITEAQASVLEGQGYLVVWVSNDAVVREFRRCGEGEVRPKGELLKAFRASYCDPDQSVFLRVEP